MNDEQIGQVSILKQIEIQLHYYHLPSIKLFQSILPKVDVLPVEFARAAMLLFAAGIMGKPLPLIQNVKCSTNTILTHIYRYVYYNILNFTRQSCHTVPGLEFSMLIPAVWVCTDGS